MIKLITCDIDGTLVHDYTDQINPKIFELIEKFEKKGVLFFATSGRQLYNLKQIFEPVKDKIGYIAENGAVICYKNEIIFKSKIEDNLVRNLIKKILELENTEVCICGEKSTYVIPKTQEFYEHIGQEIQNHTTIIKKIEDIEEDIIKISMFTPSGMELDTMREFASQFDDDFKHTVSGHKWYDFMNIGVHKGFAIEFLQEKLNIKREETAAFGDNFNDIEMLKDAGFSYAMENAHDDVKKFAKYTCKDVAITLELLYNELFD